MQNGMLLTGDDGTCDGLEVELVAD